MRRAATNPKGCYSKSLEYYVAESAENGGTWTGATDGLRKGRTIYVRYPEAGEQNANMLLIRKGAKAVDAEGKLLSGVQQTPMTVAEESGVYVPEITRKIIDLLKSQVLSVKQIKGELSLDWSEQRIRECLKDLPGITTPKRGKYTLISQLTLF